MDSNDKDFDAWLTTEKAAERMGFSRPYTAALLDSNEFAGKVSRTNGNHRRVLASAVEEYMQKRGIHFPLTKEDQALLNEPTPAEFFRRETLSPAEEEALHIRTEENRERSLRNQPGRSNELNEWPKK